MKQKIKYFLLTILMFIQLSCNNWMELIPPEGLIKEEFWKSKEDVEAVLMAAYESFSVMDRSLFLYGELRGDLLKGGLNQSSEEQNIMENNIYPDNSFCNWANFYKVINYCNEVIKNAPLVQKIDNTFNDFHKQGYMAEAYFLRSLCYFYLVRIYHEVPLMLDPTDSDNTDVYLPKSTEEVVLTQIVNDLNENRAFAPSGSFITVAANKGRASKAAYDALLADIALWRFKYDEVLSHVEKIEAVEDLLLMPGAKWFEIFYPGNSLESIFEFQYDGNIDQPNGTFDLTQQYSLQYSSSQKAIEIFAYEFTSELVRGEDVSISKISENNFIIWKYVGQAPDGKTVRSGTDRYGCNWIVYRLADVLLMKAEALSQLGRYNEAMQIVNEIRDRANVATRSIAFNAVAFEDAILEERALEFAYEGKRWFDLLRMGRRNNFARKNKLIEVMVSNASSTQKRVLAAKLTNPLGWYLPIYNSEIERNIKLVQNPYYVN
jgi:starch-binding outer membrane protein, SusD/RagB family